MNRAAKKAVKLTGKKYGGIIHDVQFLEFNCDPPVEGRSTVTVATGNLSDDPNRRFGMLGNFGMRTSYIIKKRKTYIETRNTIYEYKT